MTEFVVNNYFAEGTGYDTSIKDPLGFVGTFKGGYFLEEKGENYPNWINDASWDCISAVMAIVPKDKTKELCLYLFNNIEQDALKNHTPGQVVQGVATFLVYECGDVNLVVFIYLWDDSFAIKALESVLGSDYENYLHVGGDADDFCPSEVLESLLFNREDQIESVKIPDDKLSANVIAFRDLFVKWIETSAPEFEDDTWDEELDLIRNGYDD